MATVVPLVLTVCSLLCLSCCIGRSCIESERRALLDVRAVMYEPDGWLDSWRQDENCCSWRGVSCDNLTGHVTVLDLHFYPYGDLYPGPSKLSPSLFSLLHLKHLDLSMNNFHGAPIPEYASSLVNLEYLNLSDAGFGGTIPHQLGNLSNLHSLDFSSNLALRADELHWLSRTTSLNYLDLSYIDLSSAVDWTDDMNMLPSLSVLNLSGSGLSTISAAFPNAHNNFTSLTVLDLSANSFLNVPLPGWLFNISSLIRLNLGYCQFSGELPIYVGYLGNLTVLDLANNSVGGEIHKMIGALAHLEYLDLSYNMITGEIPQGLGKLSKLTYLRLRNNTLGGEMPNNIGNLTSLQTLDISHNSIRGHIPESLCNLSLLQSLDISDNFVSGQIPESMGNLRWLTYLDLSSNRISGVPSGPIEGLSICNEKKRGLATGPSEGLQLELGNNYLSGKFSEILGHVSAIIYLDISSNSMEGVLRESHFANLSFLETLDLSHNKFHGPIPNIDSSLLTVIRLSGNSFSGPIPLSFTMIPSIQVLDFSQNHLNGSMPPSLCNMFGLQVLDLSDNNLVGKLPSCLNMLTNLAILDLSSNNLTGQIPDLDVDGSYGTLQSLHLRNNGLFGRIPESLKYCYMLVLLDLGGNRLSGPIPTWIGESLSSLKVLSLRGNQFSGGIPHQLANLSLLQVLDLSHNNISGIMSLPFGNFVAMTVIQRVDRTKFRENRYLYEENMELTVKGRRMNYSSILSAVTSIDISDNNLSGEIPSELTQLWGLLFLNLSRNHFTGNIPDNIGDMGQLESLDLSMNNLSGTLPLSMSRLLFLSRLNVSHNKLTGRIPSGNQLQTLNDPSIYSGNDGLCGPPLQPCRDDRVRSFGEKDDGDEDGRDWIWICASGVLGFVAGFWAFVGTLMIKKSIRYAFFRSVDKLYDWICGALVVNYGRLKYMTAN